MNFFYFFLCGDYSISNRPQELSCCTIFIRSNYIGLLIMDVKK